MKNNYLLLTVLILSSFSITGCFGVSDEFCDMKETVLKGMDRKYKTEVEFSLGSVSLSMIHGIVKLSNNDDEAAEILGNISSVQIGKYNASNRPGRKNTMPDYHRIIHLMENEGWHYIVKDYEQDKLSLIFVGTNSDERFEDIFIINIEHNELVMVEVHGNLEKIVELALRDHKIDLDLSDL